MSVEFEGDTISPARYQSRTIIGSPTTPSFSNFFVKIGLAKTPTQAYKLLIYVAIICVVLAIIVYYVFVAHSGHAPVPASAIYQ